MYPIDIGDENKLKAESRKQKAESREQKEVERLGRLENLGKLGVDKQSAKLTKFLKLTKFPNLAAHQRQI